MNLDDFIKKWTGKECDFDGHYGTQCVDLYRFYLQDVLGIPQSPPVAGAADIWDTAGSSFVRIPNTPEGVPNKGDIVIWSKNTGGGYGHVAIFVEGGVNSFRSFDCNWPTGSLPHIQGHYYTNVIGWLRPKEAVMSDEALQSCLKDREKFWKERDEALKRIEEMTAKQEDLLRQLKVANDQCAEERKRFSDFKAKIAELLGCRQDEPTIFAEIKNLVEIEDQLAKMRSDNKELNLEIDRLEDNVKVLTEENKRLKIETEKPTSDDIPTPVKQAWWKAVIVWLKNLF